MKCKKCGRNLLNPKHFAMDLCDWISALLIKVAGFFGSLGYYFDYGKWPRS